MRKDCKYYLLCGYGRGKESILCNGKIARGNHIEEAFDNKAQSSSKNTYKHVCLTFYCWWKNKKQMMMEVV